MKNIVISFFLAFVAMSANAQFLFRISGNQLQEPSYILGTIHTLPGSLLDSIPEYLEAETKCRQLFAEYDVSSQQAMTKVQEVGLQAITLPDDKTIFDVMDKEQIDLLDTRFKEVFHVSITDSLMKSVWKYQPLVLTTSFNLLLTVQEMQKHPEISMSNTPIDLVCINRAKERGMAFGQLDEIQPEDSLKKMRDTMNEKIDDQIDSLMNYLQDFEHRKQMVANEIEVMAMSEKCWKEADYDNYASLPKMVTEVNKQPAVFKQRNEKWLPKLQAAMSEAPTMFVFGAGHLIGEYGVLQLLRQAGYDVEQIKRIRGTRIRGTGNLIH